MVIYQLKETFKGFKKGTILLQGAYYQGKGTEYFDISEEIASGHSYSVYNIPSKLLIPLPLNIQKSIQGKFNDCLGW